MPSRLIGKKEDTDGAIEFLLLKQLGNAEWETDGAPRQTGQDRHSVCYSVMGAARRGTGNLEGGQPSGQI